MPMMSPPLSSSSPAPPRRRLSSRRGSVSAFDPYAKHAEMNYNPERSSFSTLTIVRVPPPQPAEPLPLHEPPTQRRHHSHNHNHNRTGSGGRGGPPAPSNSGSGRLSFAFSTFAPPGGQGSGRGERASSPSSSPTTSPRLRPSSPHRLSSSGSTAGKPRLTPDQLYEVAQRARRPSQHNSPGQNVHEHNATFTPLPPAVYLPFVDRPSEVAALISSTPTKKLFALLSQTFPKQPSDSGVIPASPSCTSLDDIPSDPTKWSYTHLITFATKATRSVAADALFVALLRKCILTRSELIWERVKGALGVPPELDMDLDVDFDVDEGGDVFDSSSSEGGAASDMEDEGMKAKGHWDGWDAMVVESPSVEKDLGSVIIEKEKEQEEQFKAKVDAALTAPHRVKALASERSDTTGSGQTTISPTPRPRSSPPNKQRTLLPSDPVAEDESITIPKIVTESPTPHPSKDTFEPDQTSIPRRKSANKPTRSPSLSSWLGSTVASEPEPEPTWSQSTSGDFGSNTVDFGLNPSPDGDELGGGSPLLQPSTSVDVLSIEPVVSSPSMAMLSPGANPPPLSLEGGGEGGLGDIMEGEEEEDEAAGDSEAKEKEKEKEKEREKKAMRIEGLRFALSPIMSPPASPAIGSPTQSFWSGHGSREGSATSSPVLSKRPLSWGSSSSRRSSFGAGSPAGLTRTGSSGSLTGMAMQLTGGSFKGEGVGGYGYDPVGDRVPGNPLFPSNFARLATGPTLAANNPSLRSKAMPPAPRFSRPLLGIGSRRGSNTSMSDYAVTLASESVGSGAHQN
ncbi:hypothetical protein V5O48_009683 [Marasmius crinis-equi]|uniref:Uncharacterized protein n=1 Tax=Marasmius crinis-equi TaxID=585013 RepID=A0ABR3FAK3_9AGAR